MMVDAPIILVVDDEENFREIFQAKLSAAGFHVETAQGGDEAIVKAQSLKPTLVLMDVKMPGMDGTQAAAAIRENPELKNTKVVFLTSLGDPNMEIHSVDRKFAEGMGFQGYIKKTDDLSAVVEKVKGFLG